MILYVIATDAMQPALSLLVMAEAKTFHFARSTRTCLTEKNQSPRQQPLSAPDRWALCISNAAKSLFHKRQKKRQHCMVLQWFLKYCDRCPQNDLLLSCKPLPLPTLLLTSVLPLPLHYGITGIVQSMHSLLNCSLSDPWWFLICFCSLHGNIFGLRLSHPSCGVIISGTSQSCKKQQKVQQSVPCVFSILQTRTNTHTLPNRYVPG
mmetsp:Transcript_20085/g.30543  ORF Transcript_20085/g.30543 Transcript_20085/m.30543 type:complete len:207 (+) Transcript_20085:706-1326(+)